MTIDTIVSSEGGTIQHGGLNDRVYLMRVNRKRTQEYIVIAENLARTYGYSKIISKVPASELRAWEEGSYRAEAVVPGLFGGQEDCYFMVRYPRPERQEIKDRKIIEDVLETAFSRSHACGLRSHPPGIEIRPVTEGDAACLANLYGRVFKTYPFPIMNPAYIRATMKTHIRYYCATNKGRLVAGSSAEIDQNSASVELTDFATEPSFRGMGLCPALLEVMVGDMRKESIFTAFTIARASEYPINVTFARAGFQHGGTLYNNTNICGSFESMNVWYKRLRIPVP
jgi:putative beta-lysine N-acetyltransferase